MLKKISVGLILIIIFFIVDRNTWMPIRTKKIWIQRSGRNLGDPIAYQQDFILQGSQVIFQGIKNTSEYKSVMENRKSKFYLIGCYFGSLYIYDINRKEITTYFND